MKKKQIVMGIIVMVMLFTAGCKNTQTTNASGTAEITQSDKQPAEQPKPTQAVTKEQADKEASTEAAEPASDPIKEPEIITEADTEVITDQTEIDKSAFKKKTVAIKAVNVNKSKLESLIDNFGIQEVKPNDIVDLSQFCIWDSFTLEEKQGLAHSICYTIGDENLYTDQKINNDPSFSNITGKQLKLTYKYSEKGDLCLYFIENP